MSIQSEIERIGTNVTNTLSTIAETGVEVASDATSDDLPSLAAALANTKQDLLSGVEGQVVGFNADGTAEAQYLGGLPCYTAASEDGVTYTVTIPWIEALAAGQTFVILPGMTSTSTNTKINVNGLGAKYLRRPLTTNNAASTVGYSAGWIIANKPVVILYDGTYFKAVSIPAPDANTIYGTVKIENGGTGAVTAEAARENIGAASAEAVNELSDKIDNCVPKNQGAANVGKILAVGTDGNLVLVDMPDGGASGDVVGVLDDSNNILLTGDLADGTYTLKYENADGTYTEIGTLEVGAIEEPEEIVNWIPLATDSGGAIYNGVGYKSGVRLKSDGVTESTDVGDRTCLLTGYIPVVSGDVIRTKNVSIGGSDTGYISYLWLYNSSFAKVGGDNYGTRFTPTLADGIYTFTIPNTYAGTAYMRLQAQMIDNTSILTVNQEIE